MPLSEGQTVITINVSIDFKRRLRMFASSQDRSLSDLCREMLQTSLLFAEQQSTWNENREPEPDFEPEFE